MRSDTVAWMHMNLMQAEACNHLACLFVETLMQDMSRSCSIVCVCVTLVTRCKHSEATAAGSLLHRYYA